MECTWTYRLALVLAGAAMLLLPVVYLGIICLVAYGMYLHAVYDVRIFGTVGGAAGGRGAIAGCDRLLWRAVCRRRGVALHDKAAFRSPGECGTLPVANARRRTAVVRVCRADMRCGWGGRPRRIDVDCQVNASASFRRGLWSMIVGNDLVLTIGLPSTAGISVEQFASMLAHEFGHFSQGMGMRMSFLVRTISFWFTRVVYDRDQWDQRLVGW